MRDWDSLRFFLAVARAGSLARAATSLGVNKSTAFRRLVALEEELGARLLEVRARRYVPTEAGLRLLERASALEESIQGVERELAGKDAEIAGGLTLATTEVLAREILAPHLAAFADAHPEVRLTVVTANRLHAMSRGEAHVALRHGPRPTEPELVVRRIAGVAATFYASKRYLDTHSRPRTVDELAGHRLVAPTDTLAHLAPSKRLARLAPRAAVVHRYSDLGAQVAAVEAGLGVALLPCFAAERRPSLVRLLPPEAPSSGGLFLVWHADLRGNARVRAFVTHLQAALEGDRALFEGSVARRR